LSSLLLYYIPPYFTLSLVRPPPPPPPPPLSLHDALPICPPVPDDGLSVEIVTNGTVIKPLDSLPAIRDADLITRVMRSASRNAGDRKSTRLNSSHVSISYAVFCLKKKKKKQNYVNITQDE